MSAVVRKRTVGLIALCLILLATLVISKKMKRAYAQTISSTANLDWPYYGNDLGNGRFQNVDQINTSNVAQLKPAWIFHTGVHDPQASMEVSPIVVSGIMYLTSGDDDVFAVNAQTGKQIWAYHPTDMPPLSELFLCCSHNNRGVAQAGNQLFLARLDATLVSLDKNDGHVLWKAVVDNWRAGYSITMAPQYAAGKVIVGVSGGEYLIRGHVDAYDATSGKLVWRFWTTDPATFAGDSWKHGGGPVWQTPAYDPDLGTVYFSVGNVGPDINGVIRAGLNLYTVSVVAVDVQTGKLRWYFQESHHDLWDYDATPPVMLFSLNGVPALTHAGKTGYLFILDRRNGSPLYPVVEKPVPTTPEWQNPWPTQPESMIESLTPHSVGPLPKGYVGAPQWTPPQQTMYTIQPGDSGGLEWPPMGYSPRTRFIYHDARYAPVTFRTTPKNIVGGTYPGWGSTSNAVPNTGYGIYGAIDSTTGKIAWKIKVKMPADSGMTVGGDIVYFGDESGIFYAVDARTGAILWTFNGTSLQAGGAPTAAPIVYMVNGREFVADAFGGNPGEKTKLGDIMVAFSLPK